MPVPMVTALIGAVVTVEALLFGAIWWASKDATEAAKIIALQLAIIVVVVLILVFWVWVAGVPLTELIPNHTHRSES